MTETNEMPERDLAQFFFEVGFGACFAEAMIRNDMKPPFEFSDAFVEAAWPRSIEAHEDGAEMDRFLELARLASKSLSTDEEVRRLREALRPFAELADTAEGYDWIDGAGFTLMHHHKFVGSIRLADLRRAREAHQPKDTPSHGG